MFSALKTLDPLDDQREKGEERDRDPDENHVGHQVLLGFGDGLTQISQALKGPPQSCASGMQTRSPKMRTRSKRAVW